MATLVKYITDGMKWINDNVFSEVSLSLNIKEFYEGVKVTIILPLNAIDGVFNGVTKRILWLSLKRNVFFYFLPTLILEIATGYDPFVDKWIDLVYHTILNLRYILYLRFFLCAAIDNSILNLLASNEIKGSGIVHTLSCKRNNCKSRKSAGINSTLYYLSNNIAIFILSFLPFIGGGLALFLKSLLYGQSLIEYELAKMNKDGMCYVHRAKYFARHNLFCLGLGFGIVAVCNILTYIIGYDNFFIYDALFNTIYSLFVISFKSNNILSLIKKESIKVDFFYLFREATRYPIYTLKQKFMAKIEAGLFEGDTLEKVLKSTSFQILQTVLLGGSFTSLQTVVRMMSVNLFIELYYNDLYDSVIKLKDASKRKSLIWVASEFGDYIPSFILPSDKAMILKALKSKKVYEKLCKAEKLLVHAMNGASYSLPEVELKLNVPQEEWDAMRFEDKNNFDNILLNSSFGSESSEKSIYMSPPNSEENINGMLRSDSGSSLESLGSDGWELINTEKMNLPNTNYSIAHELRESLFGLDPSRGIR